MSANRKYGSPEGTAFPLVKGEVKYLAREVSVRRVSDAAVYFPGNFDPSTAVFFCRSTPVVRNYQRWR